MSRILLIISLLAAGHTVFAQHHHYHHKHGRTRAVFHPRQNAFTGGIGLGAMAGFAAIKGNLEYECFLSPNGAISITVSADGFTSGTVSLGEADYDEVRTKLNGGYIAPGVRFHANGNAKRADVAVGFSFPMG